MPKRPPKLQPSTLLIELAAADNPPTELKPYVERLDKADAFELRIAARNERGVILFDTTPAESAPGSGTVVWTRNAWVSASEVIDWQGESGAPIRDALDSLLREFEGFDRIARFRFAATDMRLAKDAASGLIAARDNRGMARAFERVIETGMVVTYARPYLPGNYAGVHESHDDTTWWPEDEDGRALHSELIDLRHQYHAHADHSPQRMLQISPEFGTDERPALLESWSQLPVEKLQLLHDVAAAQAERFQAEADRLSAEVFRPDDD